MIILSCLTLFFDVRVRFLQPKGWLEGKSIGPSKIRSPGCFWGFGGLNANLRSPRGIGLYA